VGTSSPSLPRGIVKLPGQSTPDFNAKPETPSIKTKQPSIKNNRGRKRCRRHIPPWGRSGVSEAHAERTPVGVSARGRGARRRKQRGSAVPLVGEALLSAAAGVRCERSILELFGIEHGTKGSRRTQSTTRVGRLEAAGALGVVAVGTAVADDEHASALAAARSIGRHVCGGVVV